MKAQEALDEARLLMESFDPANAMTIGFDKPYYTLTREQMLVIARALYLVDCELHELQQNQCK